MNSFMSKIKYISDTQNQEYEMIINFYEGSSNYYINVEMDPYLNGLLQIRIEDGYLKILPEAGAKLSDFNTDMQIPLVEKLIKLPEFIDEHSCKKTINSNIISFIFPKKPVINQKQMYY